MYYCNLCNYETYDKSNLNHHNKTQKHIHNNIIYQKKLNDEKIKNIIENELINQKESEIIILKEKLLRTEIERDLLIKEKEFLLKERESYFTNKIKENKKNYKIKEKIPATLKNKLWRKHFSTDIVGKCLCCDVESISIKNFDCGHIISEKNGGNVSLNNMKPICRLCNSSMSTMNMDEFIKKYEFDSNLNNPKN
jgi:hypothetical protein